MQSLALSTADATEQPGISSFTFDLPHNDVRQSARKLSLASVEFPMVQYTVEEAWNRLYYNEGIRFDPENHVLCVTVVESATVSSVEARLPLTLNEVVRVTKGGTEVHFRHPHGLEAQHELRLPLRWIGGRRGDVVHDELAEVLSPTSVRLGGPPLTDTPTHLLVPRAASPCELAEWIQATLGCACSSLTLRCKYDEETDCLRLTVRTQLGAPSVSFAFAPTPLLQRLGWTSMPIAVTAVATPLPCQLTCLWDYACLTPAHYGPCHRSMGSSQPLRFEESVERALNRFYLPLHKEEHVLVFSDPSGCVHMTAVTPGRYTADGICQALEESMGRAATDAVFSVYHDDEGHFVFACEREDRDAPFGLLFHHPRCIDAGLFGFPPQPLVGASLYRAPVATRTLAPLGRPTTNLVRIMDVPGRNRFSLHAVRPPALALAVTSQDARTATGRTHLNDHPFAHGCALGDVVQLSGEGLPAECTSVVVGVPTPTELVVSAPFPLPAATLVSLVPEPWNFSFARPGSLPRAMIGAGASILYGRDGSVVDATGARLPPVELPRVHNLDHPNMVLITLSETSCNLLHQGADDTTRFFAKLPLYPQFRHERQLIYDGPLTVQHFSRFTIGFFNPDRTPYHLHGQPVTFTLNLQM